MCECKLLVNAFVALVLLSPLPFSASLSRSPRMWGWPVGVGGGAEGGAKRGGSRS